MGLLVIIPSLIVLGWLGGTILAQPITRSFNRLIKKTPFVELIYNSTKDLLIAVMGQKKKFSQPIMVQLNKENELFRLGYITQTDLSALNVKE